MEILDALLLGKPVWMWSLFAGVVLTLLVLDLGVLHRSTNGSRPEKFRSPSLPCRSRHFRQNFVQNSKVLRSTLPEETKFLTRAMG